MGGSSNSSEENVRVFLRSKNCNLCAALRRLYADKPFPALQEGGSLTSVPLYGLFCSSSGARYAGVPASCPGRAAPRCARLATPRSPTLMTSFASKKMFRLFTSPARGDDKVHVLTLGSKRFVPHGKTELRFNVSFYASTSAICDNGEFQQKNALLHINQC